MLILSGQGPLNKQIYDAIRKAILTGQYKPNERLPSSRVLAQELGVSRNAIVAAFEHLISEGYLESFSGSGTYVSSNLPEDPQVRALERFIIANVSAKQASVPFSKMAKRLLGKPSSQPKRQTRQGKKLRYDFLYGSAELDEQAHNAWRRLVTRHVREMPTRSLGYGSTLGFSPLRQTIADYLYRTRMVKCAPEQIMITTGSRQGIYMAAELLLDEGDKVILEDPHYIGAREIFASFGASLCGIPVDMNGMLVERLRADEYQNAKLLYITPSHQFPSGGIMPVDRRLALVDWAEETGTYIIEDDYDCEYGYKARPVEAVQSYDRGQRVVYVGTLSKVLFPALRLGYVVLPQPLVGAYERLKWLLDRHTAIFEQKVLNDFILQGDFERHLRRSRKRNTARRLALIKSLETYLGDKVIISGARAGMHLLVWFKNIKSEQADALIAAAAAEDIGLYPISPYYFEPPEMLGLLFAFGTLTGHQIHEGIKRLSRVVEAFD